MSLLFVCCYVFYCAFNVCAFDQRDKVVRKIHSFENDGYVSWFLQEEQRRSSLGKGISTSGSMSEHSIDSAPGGDQFALVGGENCDVVQYKNEENGKLVVVPSLPKEVGELCVAFGFVFLEDE